MNGWSMPPPVIDEAIRALADDRTSGSSKLARQALEVMDLAIAEAKGRPESTVLADIARRVSEAQPAMSIVYNVAHLVAKLVSEGQDPKTVVEETARELASARERIARTFLKVAAGLTAVVTLSDSENVLATLRLAHGQGVVKQVHVMESRPRFEGRTLAASLAEAGIPVTVVPDALGATLMADASCVVVGTDGILRDGAIVNKVGTYALALAAADRKKPFYVVGETLKFDARNDGASWPLPLQRDPHEVWDGAPERIHVMNQYFEVVPGRLVTTVVTERGAYSPEIIRTMLAQGRSSFS